MSNTYEVCVERIADRKGAVSKKKTRVVVCGNERVEYQEDTFSPVAHVFIIKLKFCFPIQWGWIDRHIDIENAFLNGQLERPMNVEKPKRVLFIEEESVKLFRLRRILYGLTDVVKIWNKLRFNTLTECGVKERDMDPCVFVGKKAVVLCYVGDLILFTKDDGKVHALNRQFDDKFQVKNLSRPKRFLESNLV